MTDKKPIRPDGIYTPVVPPYVPPRQKIERGTANTINRAEPREKLLNVAGYGEVVPVLYGEDRVGGVFIAGPVVKSGFYICAIAWSATNEHGIEGVQQVVVNGSTAAISGATITHYKGTQTTVDATLAASFVDFAETYEDIAYTVFKIPAAGVNGVPRLEAVVRGMKIKDPRTDVVSWTENPALHMFDFVTNDKYGAGMTVRGLTECADYCDSDYQELPRCRAAIYVNESHQFDVQLDMFAAYAECLWSYEGSGVFIVPDAIVTPESIVDIPQSCITRDTLRLNSVDASSVPTRVTVTYTTPSAIYSDPWPQASVKYDASGVTTGALDVINSDIKLVGLHRDIEARRKCVLRLKRLSVPARISFQMQDEAIAIQRGDVVRLPDVLGLGADYLVRIMSNELVSYGQYQLTAEQYSESMYDVNVSPADDGLAIPVGGIIAYFGDGVPSGFSAFNSAGDRLLKGCALGDEGEYDPPTLNLSGNTNTSGDHTHSNMYAGGTGSSSGGRYTGNAASGAHSHGVSGTATVVSAPKRFGLKLIKADIESAVPISGAVFANGSTSNASYTEFNSSVGLLVAAGLNAEITGSGSLSECTLEISDISFTAAGGHEHGDQIYDGSGFSPAAASLPEPPHTHTLQSGRIKPRLRSLNLALYVAQVAASLPNRVIIGFEGAVIPSGWQVCSDAMDAYIKISKSSSAGVVSIANNSPLLEITTNSAAHYHSTAQNVSYLSGGGIPTGTSVEYHSHTHTASISDTVQPHHYKLVFIEPSGE